MSDFQPQEGQSYEVQTLSLRDLQRALRRGWADFCGSWRFGLVFAGIYVLGFWAVGWALAVSGQIWLLVPIALGFPLLGPFVAVGFYEISRRLERSAPLDWRGVMAVIWRQKDRQIPSIAAIIVIFFLFWNFVSHMIFALFMGLEVMTNIQSSLQVFLTFNGLMMLCLGTLVGAIFAATLYAMVVVALPMLLDLEIDFVTAMLTSIKVVQRNPVVMSAWGLMIAVLLGISMLMLFVPLLIVLPLLGHASWHLYRAAVHLHLKREDLVDKPLDNSHLLMIEQ